jgi:hypothetical protein
MLQVHEHYIKFMGVAGQRVRFEDMHIPEIL